MRRGRLAQIATPAAGNRIEPGVAWCADNGVFGDTYPGDAAYLSWLADRDCHRPACVFVVAPDVVGDAEATLARSAPMLPAIRALGYPVAYALQNGATPASIPWRAFDVAFIGGDTAFKLGPAARQLVEVARARGIPVHMGRVNSRRRLQYAHAIGCASVDGTFLTYGPDLLLPRLLGWLRELDTQPPLFDL